MHPKLPDDTSAVERPRLYSAAVAEVIRDITQEFHDTCHYTSNCTQALNLWRASNLDVGDYIELLYTARGITRARGNILLPATDGGLPGTRNRMPYYFAVLRRALAPHRRV